MLKPIVALAAFSFCFHWSVGFSEWLAEAQNGPAIFVWATPARHLNGNAWPQRISRHCLPLAPINLGTSTDCPYNSRSRRSFIPIKCRFFFFFWNHTFGKSHLIALDKECKGVSCPVIYIQSGTAVSTHKLYLFLQTLLITFCTLRSARGVFLGSL